MSQVFIVEEERVKEDGHSKIRELSKEEVIFHSQPHPKAEAPSIEPFPKGVVAGLWIGILLGGLLGMLFGSLLVNFTWVIPGWEGLYSMKPAAFVTFWSFMGIGLGIILAGIGTILLTPARNFKE